MISVTFDYDLRGLPIRIFATCKEIVGSEYIEGLTISFLGEDDMRLNVKYDKDLFEDIEAMAVDLLAESYFNPELHFYNHHWGVYV